MAKKKENEYIKALAAGESTAFDYIFLQYHPKIKYYILHFVKSEEIAKDLSQDIFEKIWINRKQMTQVNSFNSYIFHMAKNSALNYFEHLNVRNKYIENYKQTSHYSIEEEITAKEIELLVQMTVELMPEQRKCVYKMSRELHMKNKEIAQKLKISEATVKNHLTLALRQIREAITFILFVIFSILD